MCYALYTSVKTGHALSVARFQVCIFLHANILDTVNAGKFELQSAVMMAILFVVFNVDVELPELPLFWPKR